MQLIATQPVGDNTLISVNSTELSKHGYEGGFSNCPAAYLTGLVFGKRALDAGFNKGILDIGRQTPIHGSNVYAALKGAIDSGMSIPHEPAVFPTEERLAGLHIGTFKSDESYAELVRAVKEAIIGRDLSEEDKGTA